jgi:hypothetical protein
MREIKNGGICQNVIENKGQEKAVFAYPRMFMKIKLVSRRTRCPKTRFFQVFADSVPRNAAFAYPDVVSRSRSSLIGAARTAGDTILRELASGLHGAQNALTA